MECSGTSAIAFPVVTKERFAELSGLEVGVVRGMIDRGYLPTVKIGRHRMINLDALVLRFREASHAPGHPEKFCRSG